MFSNLFASLLQFFIIDPLASEVSARLAQAQVPAAMASQVTNCVSASAPALVDKVSGDPMSGLRLAAEIWLGTKNAEDIVTEAAPACSSVVQSIRPYLAA